MAKSKAPSFNFGANVRKKGSGKKQTKDQRREFAIHRRKGGMLHGKSGS
jgi:hypothetical protein